MSESDYAVASNTSLTSKIITAIVIIVSAVTVAWGTQALVSGDSAYPGTTALVMGGTLIEILVARQIYKSLSDFYSSVDTTTENEYKLKI
jgi:hypothetical protein